MKYVKIILIVLVLLIITGGVLYFTLDKEVLESINYLDYYNQYIITNKEAKVYVKENCNNSVNNNSII